jgi:hypothetical protein
MNNIRYHVFKALLKAINKWFLKVHNGDIYIDYWIQTVERMISHSGVDWSIARLKTIRLITTRFLCGHPLMKVNELIGINKKGLPKILGPLQTLAESKDQNSIRLLMTMLSVSRALPGSAYFPPLSDITDKCTSTQQSIDEYKMLLPTIASSLQLPTGLKPRCRGPHMTTKAGIFGLALASCLIEVHHLTDKMCENIKICGGEELYDRIQILKELDLQSVMDFIGLKKLRDNRTLRRLSIVQAPDRKSRLIAILDYWSQASLKPFSDILFNILKGIEQDCTKNQVGSYKIFSASGENYHSLDLKSATDRFPLEIQKMTVAYLTSDAYADAWASLLVDNEYETPTGYTERYVKYNSGQPMGAYSSWTVFALTHHIVIRMAALKCGLMHFSDYAVLGDDVVIKSDRVAAMYRTMIASYGVTISEQKTHVSSDTYEFAKRWYRDGNDLSGAQVNAFLSSNKFYLIAQEYINLFIRWKFDISVEPGALSDIFESLGLNSKYLTRKAEDFLLLPRPIMGGDLGVQITKFVRKIYPDSMGCFNSSSESSRAKDWYMTSAAEAKARILDKAILDLIGTSKAYIRKLRRIVSGYSGTDAQSALRAVPAVELILDQYTFLNNQIEALRDPLETKPETLLFEKEIRLGFNPERLLSARRHEVVLGSNMTLVNNIKLWTKEFVSLSDIIRQDQTDENTERAYAKRLFRTNVIGTVMPGFPL